MHSKIAITGLGIVSSIGMNRNENLQALKASRHGITRIENCQTALKNSIFVGEIKHSNEALGAILQLPSINNFSRTSMLGLLAAKQAVEQAQLTLKGNQRVGFVNSTTVGGMDTIEQYYRQFPNREEFRHYISIHDAGSNTEEIATYLEIEGLVTTISTACSSAANAIMLGARLIKSGQLDQVIVGGMDALSKFTINGFNTLMILSDEHNQPFDNKRKGLNLGEGAAYLVLESTASCQKRNIKPQAYLSGYANANDAFHQTASSEDGEGAFLAMKEALNMSGLPIKEIDYINAHGTATPNNDLSEGRAIARIFGKEVPLFSSTKPFTGHTLAAAASIEAVFSIFSIQEGIIFPNLNFSEKMTEFDLLPETQLKVKNVKNVLSNSFGFGGNCSSLIFSS
jgi:3-oxoacyl-[acyl-carrier-protein] synthase-1